MKKTILNLFCLSILIFISLGYYLSDARFFNQIIKSQDIKRPIDAFNYVTKETSPIQALNVTSHIGGLTPKYLLTTRKYLWCDEGAILFLVFANRLGYKTHLVDLLDNGVSRHTIAEVLENGKWVTYDYTNNKVGVSYAESAIFYKPTIRIRPYPRLYNFIVHNNYFLKKLALYLRSIPEAETPEFSNN